MNNLLRYGSTNSARKNKVTDTEVFGLNALYKDDRPSPSARVTLENSLPCKNIGGDKNIDGE